MEKSSSIDFAAFYELNILFVLPAYLAYKELLVFIDAIPYSQCHNYYEYSNYEKYEVVRNVRRIMAGKETEACHL